MSSFASRHTSTVENPHEKGVTFTFRMLSGAEVEEAQQQHIASMVGGQNPRGWAGRFMSKLERGVASEAEAMAILRDPLGGFDRLTVARYGIVSWSYPGADGKPLPVTRDKVADLIDDVLEWAAVEVMKLTKPSRFLDAEQAQEAQKNA